MRDWATEKTERTERTRNSERIKIVQRTNRNQDSHDNKEHNSQYILVFNCTGVPMRSVGSAQEELEKIQVFTG